MGFGRVGAENISITIGYSGEKKKWGICKNFFKKFLHKAL